MVLETGLERTVLGAGTYLGIDRILLRLRLCVDGQGLMRVKECTRGGKSIKRRPSN